MRQLNSLQFFFSLPSIFPKAKYDINKKSRRVCNTGLMFLLEPLPLVRKGK